MSGRGVRVHCPAKINLCLEVLGSRPDGFHEIRTLFQTLDFGDDLSLRPRPGHGLALRVAGGGALVPRGPENLVHKAYEAFAAACGKAPGLEAGLVKRIPPGTGLGGGSSDAAAMLLALQWITGRPGPGELVRLAAGIGADVPFFLRGGTAAGRGRGDRIMPLPDAPARPVLLVLPPLQMLSAEVYRALDPMLTSRTNRISIHRYFDGKAVVRPQRQIQRNDLESVIFRIEPRLAALKELLYATGADFASISGSGSALFGLYDSAEGARAAATRIGSAWGRTVVTCFTGGREAGTRCLVEE